MGFYRASFWNFVNLFVPSVVSFIITAIIGRSLSVADFGLYSYVLRILNMGSYVLISISMFAFSYYFQKKAEISEIFYTVVECLAILVLIELFILLILARSLAPSGVTSLGLFNLGIVLLPFYVGRGIFSEAFNALFDFKRRALIEIMKNAVWLFSIMVLVVQDKLTLSTSIATIYFVHLLYILGSYAALKDKLGRAKSPLIKALGILKVILRKTKYFTLATFLNFLLTFIPFLLLAKRWGNEALGVFSYNFYFSFFTMRVALAISNTLLPYSAREGKEAAKYLWSSVFGFMYMFLPILLILILLSGPLMRVIFNRSFGSFGERFAFAVLLIAYFFKAIAGNMGSVLSGLGRTDELFRISVFTLLFQITIGFALIYMFSTVGAAASFLGVYLIQFGFAIYYLTRNEITVQFFSPMDFLHLLSKVRKAIGYG